MPRRRQPPRARRSLTPSRRCRSATDPRGSGASMSESGPQPSATSEEPDRGSRNVPLTARLMLRDSLTARRAAGIIALFTAAITIVGGLLERLLDHEEYATLGQGLWFALQTVTTVGYGDVTPRQASGRFIATVIMLAAIGFLAVITAAVTAVLVEGKPATVRRRRRVRCRPTPRRDQRAIGGDRTAARSTKRGSSSRHALAGTIVPTRTLDADHQCVSEAANAPRPGHELMARGRGIFLSAPRPR